MAAHKDPQRNARMFAAVVSGKTLDASAKAEGISRSRARQLIAVMRRQMVGQEQRVDPDFSLDAMRADRDFWLTRLHLWLSKYGANTGQARDAHR